MTYIIERVARAIAAMREPTEEMILANSDACGPDDQQTIDNWKSMIDAALNPPPRSDAPQHPQSTDRTSKR